MGRWAYNEADVRGAVRQWNPEARIRSIGELSGGVSCTVLSVEVEIANAVRSVVYREHPAHVENRQPLTARECATLQTLGARGLAVPEVLACGDGAAGQTPFLLLAHVPGETMLDGELPAGAIDEMVAFLARLHQVPAVAVERIGAAPVEDPAQELRAMLPDNELGARRRVLLESAPQLSNAASLLHGDYWPGNMIWKDGRLAAVIDWEDVCVGDPLADLATARVELRCSFGIDASRAFTTAYVAGRVAARSPVNLDALPVWDAYVSSAALAGMHEWGLAVEVEAARRSATTEFCNEAWRRLENG